jgi:hypothetical protein
MRLLDIFRFWFRLSSPRLDYCIKHELETLTFVAAIHVDRQAVEIVEQIRKSTDNLYNELGIRLNEAEFRKAQEWIEEALSLRQDPKSRAEALALAVEVIQAGLKAGSIPAKRLGLG